MGYLRTSLKAAGKALKYIIGIPFLLLLVFYAFFDRVNLHLKNETNEVISEAKIVFGPNNSFSFGSLQPGEVGKVNFMNPGETDQSRIIVQFASGKTLDEDTPIYFAVIGSDEFLSVTENGLSHTAMDATGE